MKRIFELNPYVEFNTFTDLDWALESREVIPGMDVVFLNSSRLSLDYSNRFERLTDGITLAGVEIAPGDYTFNAGTVSFMSDTGRPVSLITALTSGGFFGGDRTSLLGRLVLRPSPGVYIAGSFQRNRLDFPGLETVDADLYSLRVRYGFNTRTFVSAFVQYDQVSDVLVSNVRFNLIHAPLSDVFLVFQAAHNLDPGPEEDRLLNQLVTLKVTKLFAF